MSEPVLLVLISCPADQAAHIARALVEARLAACVNTLPAVQSTYRWQDDIESAEESLLLAKTTAAGFEALRAKVVELHPYELPEIIAVPVQTGLAPYLDWVRHCVSEAS